MTNKVNENQVLYKLTDQNKYTRFGMPNACLWDEGVSHSGTGKGKLCGPGYIHAYTSPFLAVLLNPIHVNFKNPLLWEAKGKVVKNDRGLKVGCVTLTTIRQLDLPVISTTQKVIFAILCAKEVNKNPKWNKWADLWLNGSNRSKKSAIAANIAANAAAAYAVANVAAANAAVANVAAANAAYAATAAAANAANAANAVANVAAANAAYATAATAAYANAANAANAAIDFEKIISEIPKYL